MKIKVVACLVYSSNRRVRAVLFTFLHNYVFGFENENKAVGICGQGGRGEEKMQS
jgi:hypothetical protein